MDAARLGIELAAMERLHALVSRLLDCDDETAALDEVLLAIIEITGAEKGAVQLYDRDHGLLRILTHYGLPAEFIARYGETPISSEAPCGRAIQQRTRIVAEDLTGSDAAKVGGFRAQQSTPMLSRSGELLGVLSTHYGEPHRPTEIELRVLDLYARQAADFVERRRAESDLREKEDQYRTLFESIDAGFCTIEVLFDESGRAVDYRFLEINPAFESATGMKDAVGKRMREFAPDHEDYWFEIYGRIALTGEPVRFEHEAASLGRYYDVHAYRVGEPEQRRVAVLFNDITQRRRTEAALAESERRLATLVSNLPGMAYRCRNAPGWPMEFISEGVTYLAGYEPADFTSGRVTWDSITHPEDREYVWSEVQKAIRGGDPFRIEYRIVSRDGEIRWVLDQGEAFGVSPGQQTIEGFATDITEVKESERERALLAAIVSQSDDAIVSKTLDGVIRSWNKGAERIFGYSAEEAVGRPINLIIPEERRGEERDILSRLRRGERIDHFETVRVAKDGRLVDISLTVSPIRDASGRVVGASKVARDVTGRKRTEQALEVSEQRFRDLANNIDQFAWTCEEFPLITWYNQRWYDYTGTTFEEMQGMGWTKVHHPDHVDRVVASKEAAKNRGDVWEDIFPLRGKDGGYRWFLSRAQPIRDESGEIVRWFGTNTDITVQREAEAALRESEERFRDLANNIDQFAWACDELGCATWYNQRWYDYTGTTFEQMKGDGWAEVIHPEHLGRIREGLQAAVESGEAWEDTFPIRGADGAYRWFLSRAQPIRDASGEVIRWFGTNTDVTALRTAEVALRESEARARARLAELEALLETVPAIVFLAHDPECRRVTGSRVAHEFLRVPWGENISKLAAESAEVKGFSIIRGDAEVSNEELPLRRAARGEAVVGEEIEVRFSDGTSRHMFGNALPLLNEDGEPRGAVGAFVDMTERLRSEASLRAKEAELQLIAESTPVVFARCGADLRYRFVNRAAASLFGLAPEEVVGRKIEDVMGREAFALIE
ncbi:MAG: PAS domain S-box protein, partial [Planctomycetota bacterium]|nr:PAS domain S-box protein [Planctomycetota bacterium]